MMRWRASLDADKHQAGWTDDTDFREILVDASVGGVAAVALLQLVSVIFVAEGTSAALALFVAFLIRRHLVESGE